MELAWFSLSRLDKSGVLLCIVPLVYNTDKAFIYHVNEFLDF